MDSKFIGFPAIYKNYIKSDCKGKKIRDYKLAKRVFESIMMKAWEKMIKESAVFRPPHGMGAFMIVERKRSAGKGMTWYIDWKETSEKGEIVKKPNLHSGGIRHRCYWENTLSSFANKTAYRFKFVRGGKDKGYGYRYINRWIEICNKDPDKGIYRSNIR